jgi:oligopeptide/dipeptide ABC transporter ATP-binding protein
VKPLLEIENACVDFTTPTGRVAAVDGVSLRIARGETVALVGESGSGKSTLARSILRLHDGTRGAAIRGRITFDGVDLVRLSSEEMRRVRGARIAMIFQEPASALDPLFSIGDQIAETLRAHGTIARASSRERAIELVRRVGLPDPERAFSVYPHQMSGGMRQRASIAIATACGPSLLLADEPTSALDVTVQAEILRLLEHLRAETGMSLFLITHDLAVVAENARRMYVMFAGAIVEEGPTGEVLRAPAHPYTAELLRARTSRVNRVTPRASTSAADASTNASHAPTIAGHASADARDARRGCRFRWRCPLARQKCADVEPDLAPAPLGSSSEHRAACHFSAEVSRS